MYELKERKTQTRVKHEILEKYLIKWGSIITTGLRNNYNRYPKLQSESRARFLYIDYFAFSGAYLQNGEIVDGSPVIGVEALDKITRDFVAKTGGLAPISTTILFEEDTGTFNRLLDTLQRRGYAERIKPTDNLTSLQDGDIAVIRGDSSQYVDSVLEFVDRNHPNPTYSFHFVDPYGTKAVERKNIEKIVSKPHADCIINMMVYPILLRLGVALKDDLVPAEQAHAGFFDEFFGSKIWREIARDVKSGVIDGVQAERRLVDAFEDVLRGADESLWVKQLRLYFQEREQTLYHLFLTTRDPTGAFTMNEIVADAEIRQYDLRVEKRKMREQPGQATLGGEFDELTDQKRPEELQADIEDFANEIYAVCRRKSMTFWDILKATASTTAYFYSEVRPALGKLREQKRASFEGAPSGLTNNSEIRFP